MHLTAPFGSVAAQGSEIESHRLHRFGSKAKKIGCWRFYRIQREFWRTMEKITTRDDCGMKLGRRETPPTIEKGGAWAAFVREKSAALHLTPPADAETDAEQG
ncbi:MAG: hypothetical protein LM522_09505 [Candidatus Contendobacter sp.]|nr:hypothetical protein [Candidatus Contendobacter sp.]